MRKAIMAVTALFIAAAILLGGYLFTKPQTHLYGEEILFSNEYKSTSRIKAEGDSIYAYNCTFEDVKIVMTVDTVIITTEKGAIGLKPTDVSAQGELLCIDAQGGPAKLIRYLPKNELEGKENEILIYVTRQGAIVLNAKNECINQNSLPQ